MEHKAEEIKGYVEAWRAFYDDNDSRGELCKRYVSGEQWDSRVVRERRNRGEESLVFNMAQRALLRVKGEAAKLELSLKICGDNIDPKILKEGKKILERFIIGNDHMRAFNDVLNNVYDYGYGVILVTTREENPHFPSEIPHIVSINNPKKAFFDVTCDSSNKTNGRFCGIEYSLPKKMLSKEDKKKVTGNSGICSLIDFWYREPYEETWIYNDEGKWVNTDVPNDKILKKKVMRKYKIKFIRTFDGIIYDKPKDGFTDTVLPMVYWKGVESYMADEAGSKTVKTVPYIFSIMDAQSFTNYCGSAIVGRLKKMGGSKVIVTPNMIQGKENYWSDFNNFNGVLQVNEGDDGVMGKPFIIPSESLDGTLVQTFGIGMQMIDQLAGINAAQQGDASGSVVTNAGLHRQIMQGNILQNHLLDNHLHAINEVGKIIKEMLPKVVFEERDLGEGIAVNKIGRTHTATNNEVRNDIKELCSKAIWISYGASSEAEREANLTAVQNLISTNPSLAPYFIDIYAKNLNTSDRDELIRRVQALMPPGVKAVGEGSMTEEEFQQKAQEQQKQPSIEQQKLDLEKERMEMLAKVKEAELKLKYMKAQMQANKDGQNLNIKKVSLLDKIEKGNAHG